MSLHTVALFLNIKLLVALARDLWPQEPWMKTESAFLRPSGNLRRSKEATCCLPKASESMSTSVVPSAIDPPQSPLNYDIREKGSSSLQYLHTLEQSLIQSQSALSCPSPPLSNLNSCLKCPLTIHAHLGFGLLLAHGRHSQLMDHKLHKVLA